MQCACVDEEEAYGTEEEPGWLKDLEAADAIDKLRDAVQASAAADTGTVASLESSRLYTLAVTNQFSIDRRCDTSL